MFVGFFSSILDASQLHLRLKLSLGHGEGKFGAGGTSR